MHANTLVLRPGYREFTLAVPRVIDAAYSYWQAIGGSVPLEILMAIGVRQLREQLVAVEPLHIDFAGPVKAIFHHVIWARRGPNPAAAAPR